MESAVEFSTPGIRLFKSDRPVLMVRLCSVICALWVLAGIAGSLDEAVIAIASKYRDQYASGANVIIRLQEATQSAWSGEAVLPWISAESDRLLLAGISVWLLLLRPATLRSLVNTLVDSSNE